MVTYKTSKKDKRNLSYAVTNGGSPPPQPAKTAEPLLRKRTSLSAKKPRTSGASSRFRRIRVIGQKCVCFGGIDAGRYSFFMPKNSSLRFCPKTRKSY